VVALSAINSTKAIWTETSIRLPENAHDFRLLAYRRSSTVSRVRPPIRRWPSWQSSDLTKGKGTTMSACCPLLLSGLGMGVRSADRVRTLRRRSDQTKVLAGAAALRQLRPLARRPRLRPPPSHRSGSASPIDSGARRFGAQPGQLSRRPGQRLNR
jgi:hypothetical protein